MWPFKWRLSPSRMHLRFIHSVANVIGLLRRVAELYSPVEGYFSSFQLGAIMNKAVRNSHVQVVM